MTTITVHTRIEPDGTLRLEVPSGMPEGPVEALIVLQPTTQSLVSTRRGKMRTGILQGVDLGDVDIDADLQEMNRQWQDSLNKVP